MSRDDRDNALESLLLGLRDHLFNKLQNLMMSWDDIREMLAGGMQFGAHTVSHPSLPYIPLQEANREIQESKKVIEEQLDRHTDHFSFPNPGGLDNVNEEVKKMVINAGFRSAATSREGIYLPLCDRYRLRRKGVYRAYSKLPDFYWYLKKYYFIHQIRRFAC